MVMTIDEEVTTEETETEEEVDETMAGCDVAIKGDHEIRRGARNPKA